MRVEFTNLAEAVEALAATAHTLIDRADRSKQSGHHQEAHDYTMSANAFDRIANIARYEQERLGAVADEREV